MPILPLKTSVASRAILGQHEQVRQDKTALLVDPLLKLAEAQQLLGCPSYSSLRDWIRSGKLRSWRPSGRGHYKVRLSWIKEFLSEHEVRGGSNAH